MSLNDLVGKTISDFCKNGFVGSNVNHCAHFVCHIFDLEFPYNCKIHTGGSEKGANIRVHEVFAECPKVGKWEEADLRKQLLIFVTKKAHINLDKKKMINHLQKHIGIYENGFVYHYFNERDEVIKQTVGEFYDTFQRAYGGDQGLFFGHIPGSGMELTININGLGAGINDITSFRKITDGKDYYAETKDGERIFVGRKTKYRQRYGLYQPESRIWGPTYTSDDYYDRFDHWSVLLELTGYCESKNSFTRINTYDRAAFTFGFYQLAAHTPNDNFVILLRELMELENANRFLPELKLINGRVHRFDEDDGLIDLEVTTFDRRGSAELGRLMKFLNPKDDQIDDQEWLYASRLEYWAANDKSMRDKQVEVAFEILTKKFNNYHNWYGLDGVSDVICAIIADIHHQGRTTKNKIRNALESSDPIEALIYINQNYANRAKCLHEKIELFKQQGKLGFKLYSSVENAFI